MYCIEAVYVGVKTSQIYKQRQNERLVLWLISFLFFRKAVFNDFKSNHAFNRDTIKDTRHYEKRYDEKLCIVLLPIRTNSNLTQAAFRALVTYFPATQKRAWLPQDE